MTLRSKFFATLFLTAGIPLTLGLIACILVGQKHLIKEEGLRLTEKAYSISGSLKFSIYQEIDFCHAWAGDVALLASLTNAVTHFSDHPFASQEFEQVDRIWPDLKETHPDIQFFLTNALARSATQFLNIHGSVKEVLITDHVGRLLAASNKSSDYWQADEEWWQKGAARDRNSVWVEGVHYDESAEIQSLDVIAPIFGPEQKKPLGVIKCVLNINPVIATMGNMLRSSGQETIAVMPDGKILQSSTTQKSEAGTKLSEHLLVKIFGAEPGWSVMPAFLGTKSFVAHAPMNLAGSTFSRNRVHGSSRLAIVASRDYDRATSLINRQVRLLLIAGGLTITLLLFLGDRIVLHSVVRPVQKLRKATERITWTPLSSSADPNYRKNNLETIEVELGDIHSEDEIKELAGEFKKMASRIFTNEDALLTNQRSLESEVEAQTAELRDVNQNLHEHQEKLQKAVVDLESKNQDLEAFAYSVSHDLKAPLRAIGSISDWLHTDYSESLDEKGQSLVLLLQQRVLRLERLIDGILEYSRAGRVADASPVEVGKLLGEVLQNLEIDSHIEVILQDSYPTIMGSLAAVGQIFQNLIGNAVKYMDKDRGQIHVTCLKLETEWEFSVSDNGPGIDPKYHARVFKLFNTLNARDEVEGSGIGLSLVKRQVDTHGGRIWIESNGRVGSVFKFTWPDKDC